jgi:UDP-N-acetylglucosamine 1-carboxyvinyltransferase
LFFVDKLLDMGAKHYPVRSAPRYRYWFGQTNTAARHLHDLAGYPGRGVPAYRSLIGPRQIHHYNIEQIERGYQNIDARLKALGADITRV